MQVVRQRQVDDVDVRVGQDLLVLRRPPDRPGFDAQRAAGLMDQLHTVGRMDRVDNDRAVDLR